MKIKKLRGYVFVSILDEENDKFPTIYESRAECIRSNKTYMGIKADDPRKRGVIATAEIQLSIPDQIKPSETIREFVERKGARPGLLTVGPSAWNEKARIEAMKTFVKSKRQIDRLLAK